MLIICKFTIHWEKAANKYRNYEHKSDASGMWANNNSTSIANVLAKQTKQHQLRTM